MASQARRLLFNTRERALSTDMNDMTNLLHRTIVELGASFAGRQGGVIHGMNVSVDGVGLNVTVSEGLGLLNSGGATADDSDYDWVELEAATGVVLPAADPANPRWDVIEIVAGDVLELSSLQDVFDPDLGTFSSSTLDKRRRSLPTISVRSGTAAAIPVFPAGTAGVIPLAYVHVPAAAVTLVTGTEVLCRPIVIAVGDTDQGSASPVTSNLLNVRGGGLRKTALGIPLGAGHFDLTFIANRCTGSFAGNRASFLLPDGASFTLTYGTNADGMAVKPGSNLAMYFYAIDANAAYPAGYDSTLAPREFVIGTNSSADFGTGIVASGQRGCLVVGSLQVPLDRKSQQGAPASGAPTNLSMVGFGSVTVDRSGWAYLGAMIYRDDISDVISIRVEDSLYGQKTVGPDVTTELLVSNETSATGDLVLWTSASAIGGLGSPAQAGSTHPVTAHEVRVLFFLQDAAQDSTNQLQVNFAGEEALSYNYDLTRDQTDTTETASLSLEHTLTVDETDGHIAIASLQQDSGDRVDFSAFGYKDSILARRI